MTVVYKNVLSDERGGGSDDVELAKERLKDKANDGGDLGGKEELEYAEGGGKQFKAKGGKPAERQNSGFTIFGQEIFCPFIAKNYRAVQTVR